MFDPPESMHVEFERALGVVRGRLGADHPLYINGLNVWGAGFIEKTSPIRHELIGRFSAAGRAELEAAVTAAARAHSAWRGLEVSARVALMHRVAVIGAGGIASAADAYAKIRAGASAVQLYSALV